MNEPAPRHIALPKLIVPAKSVEPFVKHVRYRFQATVNDGRGAGVQVFCGGCCHRAFDVYEELEWKGSQIEFGDWFPTGRAIVERRCPNCPSLESCYVTMEHGRPLSNGLDGPWRCSHCGTSLARVDRLNGKIKASCRKGACRETVTATAKNALYGSYGSVDEEKARRISRWLESA